VFELPEVTTLARQLEATVRGRTVVGGSIGGRPHKFVWYNRTPEEFAGLVTGRRVGGTRALAKWLFIDLEPGYVLAFGECGGRLRYHAPGEADAGAVHLSLGLDDGSALTMTTSMWGAMALVEAGAELDRPELRELRPTPVDAAFTPEYLDGLIAEQGAAKRTAKGLLTQEGLVPGLGNALAQDILFRAGIGPRRPVAALSSAERTSLYDAIVGTVREAIDFGGRDGEVDLFGRPGGYRRTMDAASAGRPCSRCGTGIVKLQYLGGACYMCPGCQS
jgi:formamidopyrimidine-DNA glycosylase